MLCFMCVYEPFRFFGHIYAIGFFFTELLIRSLIELNCIHFILQPQISNYSGAKFKRFEFGLFNRNGPTLSVYKYPF